MATIFLVMFCGGVRRALAQQLIQPAAPGESVNLVPSDMATLESDEIRKDLPCTVTPRKTELGFDLRFHAGYDVSIPLRELTDPDEMLTIIFRVYEDGNKDHAAYFSQHIRVPTIEDDARGDATLEGGMDLGEGKYHVDWLMRDRSERICSFGWDTEASIPDKDRPMALFINAGQVAQAISEPFSDQPVIHRVQADHSADLNVKLLVNFAPQDADSAALQRSDTDALVSIVKTIESDPNMARVSLVAFNIQERRIVYQQNAAPTVDLVSLGKALQTMKLGTITVTHLSQKHGETDFLQDLIEKEVSNSSTDAIIFAGPKAMLNADVPQDDLKRIGDVECPVFYMNYNLNPQAVPWKDSISHAIRAFKGTEYTISRPRDLWFSTTEMLSRILRAKRQKILSAVTSAGSR
ncbi:MAG TPA: acetyltransferase [Bryobacteraceae bacterium]|nr:acetyltransferase [Bryobacteraceae bacterium]